MPYKSLARRKKYLKAWARKNRARILVKQRAYTAKMHATSDVWAARRRRYNGLPEPTRPYPSPAVCEICGGPPDTGRTKRLHLDHDHLTGKFRGWICRACNHMLGNAKDSIDTLKKAIKFLTRSKR